MHLSLFVSALCHGNNDSHLVFSPFVPCRGTGKAAGNQGALAENQRRSAGAAQQPGLSGRCVFKPAAAKARPNRVLYLNETKIVVINVCPGNQDERHNAVEVSAQS